VFSAILVMAAGVSLHAQPPQLSKCQSCHGTDGNSSSASVPRLNGQQPQYFANRVRSSLTSPLVRDAMALAPRANPTPCRPAWIVSAATDGSFSLQTRVDETMNPHTRMLTHDQTMALTAYLAKD